MTQTVARPRALPPPLRLRVYVALVAAVAAAVLLWSLRGGLHFRVEQIVVALLLAVMVGVAHVFPVHLAPRVNVSIDTAPAFAAALLLPVPLAILVSVSGILAGELWRRTALIQMTYNVAVAALRAAAAAVFSALTPAPLVEEPGPGSAIFAIGTAAVTMYAVNTGLIDLVVAVQRRVSPLRNWWGRHHNRMAHEASLYLLGVLVALVGASWPAALVLLAVPSVAVYRALRDGVSVRQQGRDALEEMADVIDERIPYTAGHSRRVAELARILAQRAGMSPAEVDTVYHVARVHNIGMISIRTNVLLKSGPLSESEWAEIRGHPAIGARLLARFPEFAADPELVLSHHERWDGRGYPRGLRAEQIPLGARVIAIVDALVAMRTRRPYRPLLPAAIVRDELADGRGTQFDPALVDALMDLLDHHPDFDFEGVLLFGDDQRPQRAPHPGTQRRDRREREWLLGNRE
jgi:HD-GYP domain-containing protein (c-di-GMP phosphodiesterase class II)